MRTLTSSCRLTGASALAACLLVLGLAGCGLALRAGSRSDPPPTLSVFPIPGSRLASPQTQITFRGAPLSRLGRVWVIGSRSGVHVGRLLPDSDGDGGSFLPAKPFAAGETVTVTAGVPVLGTRSRSYRFTVATPAPAVQLAPVVPPARQAGDVDQFVSRPDLQPPAVEILGPGPHASSGDIFVAPQDGSAASGPMILSAKGDLVWFHPVPAGQQADDFRVQSYGGRPVLTWWQGYFAGGIGLGQDLIYDTSYRQVAVVRAGNGLTADLHEFQLTPRGTALITAYYPVYWDASSVGGPAHAEVLDSVVQEIDVRTGLVLFQWDSLDHVPLSASYLPAPQGTDEAFDYFHVNSVKPDEDGNLVISGRNTWAAYKLSRATGAVLWTLGGKHSSFTVPKGAVFAFQHDVRVSADDRVVTVFDDGSGPPSVHTQSRGLELRLNFRRRTATAAAQYAHTPALLANFEGDVEPLPGGDTFVGWGQQPFFTEFDRAGRIVYDGRFLDANTSYRAFRFPWSASPDTLPRVSVSLAGATMSVFVSWNGATAVDQWRVLAGASPTGLKAVLNAPRAGFETELTATSQPYVAVQALDARGRVLATSATVHAG